MRTFIFLLCCVLHPLAAAEIKVVPQAGGATVITLAGEMLPADGGHFAELASNREGVLVVFSSPGGNLLAGLRIGQFIRLHNFATLVPDGQHCASACALAWLGGAQRYMEPNALIGFHAAYIRDGRGHAQESGAGNALVGAYLSRLGLSDEAILYIEQAHPDEITWLTERAARTYGIALDAMPRQASRIEPPAPPPRPPAANPDEVAAVFASTYFTHWSETNADALGYFRSAYSPHVVFYGASIERSVVMDQKRKFAERWPERVYAVRGGTVRSRCEGEACAVVGVVDWDARNGERSARTTGSANFRLDLSMHGARPLILAETGSVISRGPPEPAQASTPPP